jgi:hypothetical protein
MDFCIHRSVMQYSNITEYSNVTEYIVHKQILINQKYNVLFHNIYVLIGINLFVFFVDGVAIRKK